MSADKDVVETSPGVQRRRHGESGAANGLLRDVLTMLALELAGVQNLEALGEKVRLACDTLWQWDAFLFSIRRSGGHSQFRALLLFDTVDGQKRQFPPFNYSASIYKELHRLMQGESVLLNRAVQPPRNSGEGAFGDTRPSMSLIYVPIWAADQVVGILSLQSYTPNHFSTRDRDYFAQIAELIGPAVQRCRAEEQGRAFASLGHRLNTASTPKMAAEVIIDVADQLLGWDACAVQIYDEPADVLITVLSKDIIGGKPASDVTLSFPGTRPSEIVRRAISFGPQLLLRTANELSGNTDYSFRRFGDESRPSASLMFVPIRAGQQVVGILSIQSYTVDAYASSDLDVLQALADHCAGALERTYARQQLEESEERHRLLVENVNDGILISQDDHFIYCNARFAEMLGYQAEELRKLDYTYLYTPQGLEILAARTQQRQLGNAVPNRYETVLRHKNGSDVHVEANIAIMPDYRGAKATFAVVRDIGERLDAEARLKASEAELRALFAAMTDIILVLNYEGRYVKIPSTNTSLLADAPEQLIGRRLHDIFSQEQAEAFLRLIQRSLNDRASFNLEYELAVQDQSMRWFLATVSPINEHEVIWVARDITERRLAQEQVFRTSALYEALIDSSEDYIFVLDRDLRYIRVNSAVKRRYHIDPESRVGKTVEDVVGAERLEYYANHIRTVFETGRATRYEDHGILFGNPIYTETVLSPIRGRDGSIDAVVGVSRDITERRMAELALRESEERYALAVEAANDGLWDWNIKSNQLYLSPRWWAIVGVSGDVQADATPDDWFDRVHLEDVASLKAKMAAHVSAMTSHFEDEHRIRHQDESWRWVLIRGLCVRDTDGIAYRLAGSMSDVTLRKLAEAELQHGASHDALTGLPNRAYFLESLQKAMARARRRSAEDGCSFGVLFLDLDRFKVINDSLGHLAGDELLVATARRLEQCVRPGDTVARLGGDEFTVLLEGIEGSHDATRVADRIGVAVSQSIEVAGYQVNTTTSIGIALDAASYQKPEDLLRDADTAMYRAKAQGRARYQLFDQNMHARALAQLQMETELRRSIDEERFVLHYQPVVDLSDASIVSFEALVRWQHPEKGLIYPGEFIPVAEETAYIVPLGAYVLRQAARQARVWNENRSGTDPLRISVNLSVRQFTQPQLLEQIARILREEDTSPNLIVMELTESMLMDTTGAAKTTLESMRGLGLGLHVDDFGTGYSSLSYLHHFPLDVLKIDRSFVAGLDSESHASEILKAVVALGHGLGLKVTAEGVETARQAERLRELGCDYAQGYYYYKPMEVEKIDALIAARATLIDEHTRPSLVTTQNK